MTQDPQRAAMERIQAPARGPKGDKGATGDRGLPVAVVRAIAYLLVLNLVLIGAGYLFLAHDANGQRQQSRVAESRICTTMRRLSALEPPPGNPAANPSRKFDDELHATLDELGPDLRCR